MSKVTAFIYLLFIATRRKRKHLMTQGSIYTTKLILVKNIYIYSMFSSRILPIYAVFQPFLLLFATVHYNLQSTIYNLLTTDYWLAIANNCIAIIGGSKIECVVNNKILREPFKKCEKFHTWGGVQTVFKMHFKPFQAILDHVFSTFLGGYTREPAWKAWGCESCLTSLP